MGPKRALVGQGKEVPEGATGGRDGTEMETGNLSQDVSLQELNDLLQRHINMQQARDSRMEQEAARQEGRWKALHHQFSQLQQEVHIRTTPVPNPGLGISIHDDIASPSIRQTSQDFLQSSRSGQQAASPIPHPNVYMGSGQSAVQKEPHLQQLSEVDDIEHYFTTFERIAVACPTGQFDWCPY